MTYDILSEPETPGKFRSLSVKTKSAIRQSAWTIFFTKLIPNNKRLDIKDFGVELSNTALKIDSLTLDDSLPTQMTENIDMTDSLKASVIHQKIWLLLLPALSRFEEPLDLKSGFLGHKTFRLPHPA